MNELEENKSILNDKSNSSNNNGKEVNKVPFFPPKKSLTMADKVKISQLANLVPIKKSSKNKMAKLR
jgi:hypothetical protein